MNKKLIVICFFILAAPCLLLSGLYFICGAGSDISDYSVPELEFLLEEIDDEENMFTYFFRASNSYVSVREFEDILYSFKDSELWQEENVTKIVKAFRKYEVWEKNKTAIDFINKGFAYTKYQYPQYINYDSDVSKLNHLRQISSIVFLYKSLELFEQGKQEEAFDLISKTIKIGSCIEKTPIMLFYIVGQIVIGKNLEAIAYLLPKVVSSELLEKFKDSIQYVIPADQDAWIMSQKGEYRALCHLIDNVDHIFDGNVLGKANTKNILSIEEKFSRSFLFKPNKTKMIMADYYLHVIKNSTKNWIEIEKNQIKIEEFESSIVNRYGWQIIMVMLPINFNNKRIAIHTKIIQVLIALRLYQMENDTLPESLEILVDKYLDTVPTDDYDGSIITYSPQAKAVYSKLTERSKYIYYYQIKF